MIEMSCSTCGEKAKIQSFLTATQQTCTRCGHLLMGGSPAAGTGPAWSGSGAQQTPAWSTPPGSGSGGMWTGVIAGIFVGIAAVAGVGLLGRALPVPLQGAFLGALAAVLLAPIIAISSFLSMIFLPFSLEAILGDGIWSRVARANNERRLGPLVFPFLILIGGPMTLGALGGSRLTVIHPGLLMGAALGAMIVGALFGAVAGSMLGGSRQQA